MGDIKNKDQLSPAETETRAELGKKPQSWFFNVLKGGSATEKFWIYAYFICIV